MTTEQPYSKPLPTLTDLNRPFWDSAKEGQLVFQRCDRCQHLWYPILPACPECLSPDYHWDPVEGVGHVLSWVVFHQVYNAAFADDVPYAVALVQLDAGPRMFSDMPTTDVEIGMPVEVYFDRATDEITVPRFRPTRTTA